jgi:hypothetical protein
MRIRPRSPIALLPLAAVAIPISWWAPDRAPGQEFRVNVETGGFVTFPRVAVSQSGASVILWRGGSAQRFDPSGARDGDTFSVCDCLCPEIAMTAEDGFIAAWDARPESLGHIWARRFDPTGAPLGPEFQVDPIDEDHPQVSPVVATNGTDRFVVAWKQFIFDGDPRNKFVAQVFDGSGSKVGSRIVVADYMGIHEDAPAAVMDPAGDFVIAWHSERADPEAPWYEVYFQRFDRSGGRLGETVTVPVPGQDPTVNSDESMAMDDSGGFAIVWTSYRPGDLDTHLWLQRFGPSGDRIGESVRVDEEFPGGAPSLGLNPATGDLLVVWESWDKDGDRGGIFARRLGPAATPMGPEFRVNTTWPDIQYEPRTAIDRGGSAIAAWTSQKYDGTFTADILAKRFPFGEAPFLRGDANGDGALDVGDAVKTLFVLYAGAELTCPDAADADDDGELNLTDAVFLLRYLFGLGDPIPFPHPQRGTDDRPDALGCEG